MAIISFPLETSPAFFTSLSGAVLEVNHTLAPAQAAPASTFLTSLNVRRSGSTDVQVNLPTIIDIVTVDEESCGPCFPISINGTYDIVESLGTVTFRGEQPRHQIFLNIPTILNVRDNKNYTFTPIATTVLPPFWS